MLTQPAIAATGNRARVQRYRSKHRRIDYVPSADVLKVIEAWLGKGLNNCHAGVIDHLVLAGHRAMSGNGGAGRALEDSERSAQAREAPSHLAAHNGVEANAP